VSDTFIGGVASEAAHKCPFRETNDDAPGNVVSLGIGAAEGAPGPPSQKANRTFVVISCTLHLKLALGRFHRLPPLRWGSSHNRVGVIGMILCEAPEETG
jgi:hypothetical protein